MGMKFELNGVDELVKKLKKLQKEAVEKIAPKALKQAADVVAGEAKRRASLLDNPESPENIAKNIVVRKAGKRQTPPNAIKYRIGVSGGGKESDGEEKVTRSGKVKKGPAGGDTWYWRFIEFGTIKVSARPFMRPSMAAKEQEAAARFISSFKAELDKTVK